MNIFEPYQNALRRAAEEMYKKELEDTNLEVTEIKEFARKYKYYENEEDKKNSINRCPFDTKEEWIQSKINEWMEE